MKIKKFYEPLFGVDLTFISKCTAESLHKYLKRNHIEDKSGVDDTFSDGATLTLTMADKDGREFRRYIIWTEKNEEWVISHEVTHLMEKIMTAKNIPMNTETTEVMAYIHAYWYEKIRKAFKK